MRSIEFAIIGGAGWRAEFYLRIAEALPERFKVSGLVVRDKAKAQAAQARWGVNAYPTPDDMLQEIKPEFVVTSVPWKENPALLHSLAEKKMPVLSETPPAPDIDSMKALEPLVKKGAKIQVAEQYPFQPLNAARIALVESGKLGEVSHAQVSVAHGYHGMVLIRKLLGLSFDNASITARRFKSKLVEGPGRDGPPCEHKIIESTQEIAWLEYDGKLAVFDFTGDQYFSWVRSLRMLARGEKGEIKDDEASYLVDYLTPAHIKLRRVNAGENGNLEGYYLKGILAGEEWIYENPFAPGRLSDDEIAIADCLVRMADYADGGAEFYGLAEACQDHYFNLLIKDAIRSSQTIKSETQPWAEW